MRGRQLESLAPVVAYRDRQRAPALGAVVEMVSEGLGIDVCTPMVGNPDEGIGSE